MLRLPFLIAGVAVFLSGCATTMVPPPSVDLWKRDTGSAQREMAAYLGGKRGDEIKAPPDRDLSARIQLEPTPGRLQKNKAIGNYIGEVLTSGPYSDGYVTTANWVPITRFFRILRPMDCDTTMWVTLVNPKMVKSNPNHVSGITRDQDPSFGCEKHFHERFKDGDPSLADADGVIIDPASTEDRGGHGPFVNQLHVFMKAWAIKFVDPSDEEIVARLSKRAHTAIDILQTETVAYWIEQNKATKYRDLMRKRLPQRFDSRDMLYGWNKGVLAIARALASFEDPIDAPVWMEIVRGGLAPDPGGDPNRPLAVRSGRGNDYAILAGNALACTGDVSYVDALFSVAEKSARLPHKFVAAKVLAGFGRQDLVGKIAPKVLGTIQDVFTDAANGKGLYSCPIKVSHG